MKTPTKAVALIAAVLLACFYLAHHYPPQAESDKLSGAGRQLNMWWWSRAYPEPYDINRKYMAAWEHHVRMRNSKELYNQQGRPMAGYWTSIGPRTVGGRMLSLAINPLRHTTLFAGSAGGGIWKSYTGGVGLGAWQPVTTNFPVLGVPSILYHPSDTNIIYAATGEVYRVDSTSGTPNPGNTGFNVWKTRGTYGVGLLRTTNAGATWTRVFSKEMSDLFGIQSIRFDPNNSNYVYICATDGLHRYNNADGTTTKLLTMAYVSDVLINPSNSSEIIVGAGNLGNSAKGIFRSTNGGTSWTQITSGLPASHQGFIKFDFHTSSNTVYASIGVSASATTELYRSTNFGLNWSGISNTGHSQWQYWFAHACAVDPNDVNRVFVCGGSAKKRMSISGTTGTASAIAGGSVTMDTYIALGGQEGPGNYLHDDIHDMEFVPGRSDSLYFITDGGIFLSTNANTGTASNITFQSCNSGLVTAQFFAPVAQSQSDANFFLGGLQDNNTVVYNGATGLWKRVIGGDGGGSQIKPDDDNTILSSRDARAVYRSTDKASSYTQVTDYWGSVADSRTGFIAPLAWSSANSSRVYLASDNLHVSNDAGASFSNNAYGSAANYIDAYRKPAIAMAVAPADDDILLVSTSPFAQYDNDVDDIYVNTPANFWKTTTGNTPFTSIYGAGLPSPNRFVMDIAVHPTNSNIIWIALGGFGSGHVFQSTDGGSTWANRSGSGSTGLPDLPTNAILIDPTNPNIIYAGNDLGVYVSPNAGSNWYNFSDNLWDATQVMDLVAVPGNKIRAATHGKGVFESLLYSGTLPVILESFTGVSKGGHNELTWIVDQELNVSHYELERSSDGINFQPLKRLASRNSLTQTTYNATDSQIRPGAANYYRLRMVNEDGSFFNSGVLLIRTSGSGRFVVMGNPFSDHVRLRFSLDAVTEVQARLFDATGRLVSISGMRAANGDLVLSDLAKLRSGAYILMVQTDGARWASSLIKD